MREVERIFNSLLRNVAPPNNYISDGLVFQIDGILDQSRIPQPIVAMGMEGKPFSEYRGTVARNSANNGWYFDGATCLYVQGNTVAVNYATSTIEVVFKDYNGFTKNNFLFGTGRSDGNNIIAGTNTVSKFVYTPEANPAYEMQPTTDIVTVSASSAIGMSNGESLTASGSHSFSRWGVVSIGGRPNSTTYDLYGEIYAIRVYNRILTKAEIAHNQLLDYMRFNIDTYYSGFNYIEGDSRQQYIDTGIVPSPSMDIALTFKVNGNASTNTGIFGTNLDSSNRCRLLINANNLRAYHNANIQEFDVTPSAVPGQSSEVHLWQCKISARINGNTWTLENLSYPSVEPQSYTFGSDIAAGLPTIVLNGYNRSTGTPSVSYNGSKIYEFQKSVDGVVYKYLSRVRSSDGIAGLYCAELDHFMHDPDGKNFLYGIE